MDILFTVKNTPTRAHCFCEEQGIISEIVILFQVFTTRLFAKQDEPLIDTFNPKSISIPRTVARVLTKNYLTFRGSKQP